MSVRTLKLLAARHPPRRPVPLQTADTRTVDARHEGRRSYSPVRLLWTKTNNALLSWRLQREEARLVEGYVLESAVRSTVSDIYGAETFSLDDPDLLQVTSNIVRTDYLYAYEGPYKISGIRVRYGSDSAQESMNFAGLHGVGRRYGADETVSVGEQLPQARLVLPDGFRADERWSLDRSPTRTDTAEVGEFWVQEGLRLRADQTDHVQMQERGHTQFLSGSDAYVMEDGYVLSGLIQRYGTDMMYSGDGMEVHGTFKKSAVDTVTEVGAAYNIHGLRVRRVREDLPVVDRSLPFRLDWREPSSLSERGWLSARLMLASRAETVSAQERSGRPGFLVSVEMEDRFALDEAAHRSVSAGRQSVQLEESYLRAGILALVARDAAELEEARLSLLNATPHPDDLIALRDGALGLHGRVRWEGREQFTLGEAHLGRHGRMSHVAYDGAVMGETRSTPAVAIGRDGARMGERTDLVSGAEWMVLEESGIKEDTVQVVRVVDAGILNTRDVRRPEYVAALDTGWGNTSLDYRKTWTLREPRLLERGQFAQEAFTLTERGKLFRRSDYLEPQPEFYEQRPGRTRSALRTVADARGQLWAVWLSGDRVYYTQRKLPDSWRGHVLHSVPLPEADARSCTLVFTPAPTPVVERGDWLYQWDGQAWHATPGVDPVTLNQQLAYLRPDRATLITPDGETPLGTIARLDQSFTGNAPGVLVYNDLDQLVLHLGQAPHRQPEPDEEVASVRWASPSAAYLSPIEGTVTDT